MPVYEYQCVENKHRFEVHQPVGAEAPACPVCGSASRKVYSSVGLIFKGSGFHVTDYRRPGGSEGKTDGAPASKRDGTADGGAAATSGDASGSFSKKTSDGGSTKSASGTGAPSKASDA